MAKYIVTAPAKGYNGARAGVQFSNSFATVDDSDERQARALAYFRRRGYKVESATAKKAAPKKAADKPPADPGDKPPADPPAGDGDGAGQTPAENPEG